MRKRSEHKQRKNTNKQKKQNEEKYRRHKTMLFYPFSFLGLLFCFFLPGLVSLSFLSFPPRLCQVAFSGFLLKRWCSGIICIGMKCQEHLHSWQHFYHLLSIRWWYMWPRLMEDRWIMKSRECHCEKTLFCESLEGFWDNHIHLLI